MVPSQFIEQTWDEIGYRVKKALHRNVFVRTLPMPQKTHGGLYLPDKYAGFYGELPHMQLVRAVVLAVGADATKHYGLEVGDYVCFMRLFFARWKELEDKTYVGYLPSEQVAGRVEGSPMDDIADILRQNQ